jgi:hypothetical protein
VATKDHKKDTKKSHEKKLIPQIPGTSSEARSLTFLYP